MAPISWHTVGDMTFHCFQQRLQNGTKVDQSPFWLLKLVYPWPQRPSLKLSSWYTWAAPALYFTPYIQLAFIVPADPCLLSTASSIGSHLLYLTALTFLSTYIIFVTGVRSVLLPSESLRSRQAPQLFYSCTIHYTVLGTEPAFEAGLKSLFNDQYGWCEFLTARRPSQRSWKWLSFRRTRCCYCRVLLPTLQADCAHKKLQSASDLVLLSGSLLHLDLCINVLLRVPPLSLTLSPFSRLS